MGWRQVLVAPKSDLSRFCVARDRDTRFPPKDRDQIVPWDLRQQIHSRKPLMNVSSAEMGGLDVICSAAVRELEGSPVLDLARVLCCKEGGEWESEC